MRLRVAPGYTAGAALIRRARPRSSVLSQVVKIGDTIVGVGGEEDLSNGCIVTEGASYEALIEVLGNAVAKANGRPLTLLLKRMVPLGRALVTARKPDGTEAQFVAYNGENLRMRLIREGLAPNDMRAQRYDNKAPGSGTCGGNGLCATCVISVLAGAENLSEKRAGERQLLRNVARLAGSVMGKKRSVRIADCASLLVGAESEVFRRSIEGDGDVSLCLSLLIDSTDESGSKEKDSLDVRCTDDVSFAHWVAALHVLLADAANAAAGGMGAEQERRERALARSAPELHRELVDREAAAEAELRAQAEREAARWMGKIEASPAQAPARAPEEDEEVSLEGAPETAPAQEVTPKTAPMEASHEGAPETAPAQEVAPKTAPVDAPGAK
ncbi:hypothetical protein Ctob_005117, partial [Chrysochromulina tobinii]